MYDYYSSTPPPSSTAVLFCPLFFFSSAAARNKQGILFVCCITLHASKPVRVRRIRNEWDLPLWYTKSWKRYMQNLQYSSLVCIHHTSQLHPLPPPPPRHCCVDSRCCHTGGVPSADVHVVWGAGALPEGVRQERVPHEAMGPIHYARGPLSDPNLMLFNSGFDSFFSCGPRSCHVLAARLHYCSLRGFFIEEGGGRGAGGGC